MNTYGNNIKSSDDDDDEDFQGSLSFFKSTSTSTLYRFYLDEAIVAPAYYRCMIQTLLSCQEGDLVEIHINSPGGRLDSAKAIINAITNSKAVITGVLNSEACSAAGLIFLACDNQAVMPDATFMSHQPTYGLTGPAVDNKSQVDFYTNRIYNLYKKHYKHFLTEAEIESMLDGKTFWFDEDEICDRLKKRQAILEKEVKQAEKALTKAPKARRSKAKG